MISSRRDLTQALVTHLQSIAPGAAEFAPKAAVAPEAAAPKRNAVFAVHGISPTQRYAFQDQVALALQSYLTAQEQLAGSTLTWQAVVHWPHVGKADGSAAVRPSALRIYRSDETNPEEPRGTIYDVYEGYWSPLSKGKTNIRSAIKWLLNSLFLGSSATANIPATKEKLRSDFGYIAGLLVLAALVFAIAILIGLGAWTMLMQTLSAQTSVTFWNVISNPLGNALKLPVLAYVEIGIDVLAAYVIAQLVTVYRVMRAREQRAKDLHKDASSTGTLASQTIEVQTFHRTLLFILWGALVILLTAAYLFGVLDGHFRGHSLVSILVYIALVVLSVGFWQWARGLADFAVENVFGDIQIYTTHDNNSTYFAIRQQIIEAVVNALTGVLSTVVDPNATPAQPYYERIHIFGHSLGSTVAMDAFIRLRQMLQEDSMPAQQWKLIRSFTTFGTALEKTRFFFDVRQPTISAASDQWQNDVYGRFFTDQISTLQASDNAHGIYWSNHWYFRDIVANAIVSYQSDVQAAPSTLKFAWTGGAAPRPICRNYELAHDKPRFAWVHSDYLGDPLFWEKVGPVITGS